MQFIESEKAWLYGYRMVARCQLFPLITWLPGSCGSLLLPSITRDDCSTYH